MALADDLAALTAVVDELELRIEALENPPVDDTAPDTASADDDIDDVAVKNWVKSQIALSGGAYVTPEQEAEIKASEVSANG